MNYKKLSRISDSSSNKLDVEPFVATLLRLKNEFFETFTDVAEAADNGDIYVNLEVPISSLKFDLMPSAISIGEVTFEFASYRDDTSELEDFIYNLGLNTIDVSKCSFMVIEAYSGETIYSNYDTIYDVFPDSTDTITLPN